MQIEEHIYRCDTIGLLLSNTRVTFFKELETKIKYLDCLVTKI